MTQSKKPRGDAKLKTLPAERQGAIFEFATEHTLVETVAWLREDGVHSSKSAVSEFLSWYGLRLQFQQDESTTERLLEQLKAEVPGLSNEQLDDLGQRTFSLLAIRKQDAAAFVRVRSARARAEIERAKLELRRAAEERLGDSLELQREKFRRETCELYLRWAEDQRAKEIAAGPASNAEKIQALGKLMFGEDF